MPPIRNYLISLHTCSKMQYKSTFIADPEKQALLHKMGIRRKLFNRDNKVNEVQKDACKGPNVDEEYHCALRTKSCADFFSKLPFLCGDHHPNCTQQISAECILELGQETISRLLMESSLLSSKPELKALIKNYFDVSAEASNICTWLLKSTNQIQSSHQEMQHVLLDILECNPNHTDNQNLHHSPEHFRQIISELDSFVILENPFSYPEVPTKNEFRQINEKHSSLLNHLKHKSKKMARRIKLARCFNKATLACLALAFSAATTVAVLLAVHTLVALLMGPIALFTLPFKGKKNVQKEEIKRKGIHRIEFVKTELLRRLRGQLDMAAKGTYVLNRDFDTMSGLVMSLRDEVERNKAMAQFCLERKGDRFEAVEEVLKEIGRSQLGLRKQAEELQEHVCLCLVTINRARALVIREIVPSQQL